MAKVTKRLLWLVGTLGLILLGSSLMLPSLIRTQLQTRLSQSLHRPVSLTAVQLSLWTGRLDLQNLQVFEPDGKTLLAGVDRIQLQVSAQSLWQRTPILQSLSLIHPHLHLVLLGAHQLNISDLFPQTSDHSQPASSSPPAFAVQQLELSDGAIDFEDRVHPGHHRLDHIRLLVPLLSSLEGLRSPPLEPHLEAQLDGTRLQLSGQLEPFAKNPGGQLQIRVADLPLTRYLEYLPPTPSLAQLSGLATLQLQVSWASKAAGAGGLKAQGELTVKNGHLQVRAPRSVQLVWDQVQMQVQGLTLGIPTGAVQLDRLHLLVQGLTLTDQALRPASSLHLARMELALQPLHWPLSQPEVRPEHFSGAPDTALDLRLQLAPATPVPTSPKGPSILPPQAHAPSLHVSGTIGWSPLQAQWDLDLKHLALVPFNPYLLAVAPVLLTQGELALQGHLTLQQLADGTFSKRYQGQLLVTNLRVLDAVDTQELGRCRALFIAAMTLQSTPPSLTVEQLALNDFSTRLVLDPQGHLNLEHLTPAPATPPSSSQSALHPSSLPSSPGTQAQPAAAATASLRWRIGKIIVQGGHVHYRDHYIQPHFSADLENLGGVIAPLYPGTNARIDLRGTVNSAPLTLQGRMDPTLQALDLDLHGHITGMDLSPLTPYSDKYLGYGIAQGKLSFQADYQVRQQRLTAHNHLILDQLQLGPAVPGPEATHLPVELALSLLQDRNGLIDVNLPIEGSLDDPQFSVSGLVLRMLGNLLEKALTSPFEMLQSFFEDHRQASWIPFEAGASILNESALKKLQSLSHALQARPHLQLDLQGRALADQDAEPLRERLLARQMDQLWLQRQLAHGNSATLAAHPPAQAKQALLQALYDHTDFAKPRNALGFEKQLSLAEMKKLLLANMPIDQDALNRLAQERAQSARDWLIHSGGIAPERLSVIRESRRQAAAVSASAPGTRVDFFLH